MWFWSASQPIIGVVPTSAFDTNAERAAPPSARMSSQLTWFDTKRTLRLSRVPVVRMRSPAIQPTALRKAMTIGDGRRAAR